jgi:putative membrane protein
MTAWPATAGRTQEDRPTRGGPATFLRTAAMAGMAEVEYGKLAAGKAGSADVEAFAARMVEDHGKMNDELKRLASRRNITLASELDAVHRTIYDELSTLDGPAFDKAYIMHMVVGHKEAVALFEREANSVTDKETKDFAEKTLRTIYEHMEKVQQLSEVHR